MTYPNNQNGPEPLGIFNAEGSAGDDARTRLAAIAMEWFRDCQNKRIPHERQWYLNLAFYYGKQHVQFRQTTQNGSFDLYTPKAPNWRVRITINQVRRLIRKEMARLTAQKPNAYIVPASTEDADVFAAQAGEQIWDSLWRRLGFNKTLRTAVFWQSVCGNGFIKSYWDPTKIDPQGAPEMINPATGETSQRPGDICIENITPFHIFVPDLFAEDIEAQPYVIHAQIKEKSWVQRVFGVTSENTNTDSVDERLRSVMEVNQVDNKKNTTIVLEVWVKPNYLPELPNGGMFTVANDQVVQGVDSWPYETQKFPFSKIDAIPSGKFYTSSVIEDLIPLQRELNRTRGQLIEAKNRTSKPQLIAEQGAVNPKSITTEPGQVILYKVGMQPPQPLPIQNLPTYVTEEINRLYTDMSDIVGQHEVSNGSTPPGVTAATAISFLQEQDESLTAAMYASLEEAIEKVAAHSLSFVKMYWDEERTIKVVGLEGTFDVMTFKGADLRGNTDIRVESGSALPTSRAAKQAFIMDLMKMGFIPPEEGLEIMEVGGLASVYERIQIDKRQAQRENLKMKVVTEENIMEHEANWRAANPALQQDSDSKLALDPPLIVQVHTYDNHEVHIQVHNDYRKSQAFENASDATKALFEEHVRQHQEAMVGMLTHPLTGMDASNPNAPELGVEEDIADAEAEEAGSEDSGESTGPAPMPELSEEAPPEGGGF